MEPSWSILQVFVSNYWSQGKGEGCSHFEIWHPDLRPDVLYKKVLKLSLRRKHFGAKELLKKKKSPEYFWLSWGFSSLLKPLHVPLTSLSLFLFCQYRSAVLWVSMHYLLLAALCPPYCYCYSAASCLPVRLKPYTNWSCLGSCLTFFTGMVAAFGSTQASFFYHSHF